MEPSSESAEWHTMGAAQVCATLGVNAKRGLSDADVQQRRIEYGKNVIQEQHRRSLFSLFLSQFTDFMIIVLIVTTKNAFLPFQRDRQYSHSHHRVA